MIRAQNRAPANPPNRASTAFGSRRLAPINLRWRTDGRGIVMTKRLVINPDWWMT